MVGTTSVVNGSAICQGRRDNGPPGRANTGDKLLTLVASALTGGDCIDDANACVPARFLRRAFL